MVNPSCAGRAESGIYVARGDFGTEETGCVRLLGCDRLGRIVVQQLEDIWSDEEVIKKTETGELVFISPTPPGKGKGKGFCLAIHENHYKQYSGHLGTKNIILKKGDTIINLGLFEGIAPIKIGDMTATEQELTTQASKQCTAACAIL